MKHVANPRKPKKRSVPSNLELHRMVRAISIDLDYAIAFYETFVPTGRDTSLINRINKSDFYPAFNMISNSLHQSVVVTLCRIWDNRTDTADLNSLAGAFGEANVIAGLVASGQAIDPGQLRTWLSEVDAVNKSDELAALKILRHKSIAHRESPNVQRPRAVRGAVYGDERIVIEKTVPLVEKLGAFIGYSYVTPYKDQRRLRKACAVKFWAQVG